MKKRGRTTSDTGTSFFSKQFSISGSQNDVVTQPPKTSSTTSEISKLANSLLKTNSTTENTAQKTESTQQQKLLESTSKPSVSNGYGSSTSSSPSNVLGNLEQENKYKPVTNFKSQERINPFDKENKATSSSSTTSAHSSMSSSPSSGIYKAITSIPELEKKVSIETKIDNNKKPIDYKITSEIDKKSTKTFDNSNVSTSNTSGIFSLKSTTKSSSAFSSSQSSIDSNYSTRSTEPVLEKPIYNRSESSSATVPTLERKTSDADLIFGDKKPFVCGSERLSRTGGSLSDADVIFDDVEKLDRYTSKYRSETSVLSKSMSVTSDKTNYSDRTKTSYRIYEGIQNAAFQDYDSPTKSQHSSSTTTLTSGNRWKSEDNDFDLK